MRDSEMEETQELGYDEHLEKIIAKLKPIWWEECKDAPYLLNEEYVKRIAAVIFQDDQLGGDLDPSTLPADLQNLLQWKQVGAAVEKYRAIDYSKVDDDNISAILSRIIRNPMEKAADRLKAIQMYKDIFAKGNVDGVVFVDDLDEIDEEVGGMNAEN